jgi:hypothetical protein
MRSVSRIFTSLIVQRHDIVRRRGRRLEPHVRFTRCLRVVLETSDGALIPPLCVRVGWRAERLRKKREPDDAVARAGDTPAVQGRFELLEARDRSK